MESLKPKSAKVWWALLGAFVVIVLICLVSLWGLRRWQSHSMGPQGCADTHGRWDENAQVCTFPTPG